MTRIQILLQLPSFVKSFWNCKPKPSEAQVADIKCFYFNFYYPLLFVGKTPIYFASEVNSNTSLENNYHAILKETELNSFLLL